MTKDKVSILTFEQYEGRKDIGSSRIRGKWLAKYWENADLFKNGEEYDVMIYQKAYFVEHAKIFKGIKIFDACDPDFLHYGYRTIEMINECDAVTCSSPALTEQFKKFTDKPVVYIPDRLDMEIFTKRKKYEPKKHIGDAKKVVWYGYSSNFEMLEPVVASLRKYNLDLIVISDIDFTIPTIAGKNDIEVINYQWTNKTVYDDIVKGDIVINPTKNTGKWKFKSNNKTVMAWALGIPVASNDSDLERFISEEERNKEAGIRWKEVVDNYDVKKSIQDYEELINKIKNNKK